MNTPTPVEVKPSSYNKADMSSQDIDHLMQRAKAEAKSFLGRLPTLGPIVWLMMQQSATRHTLLSELEWRVLPALMHKQAKLYMRDESPLAYVSWARLSDEAATRYRQSPHHLTAPDWNSGDQIWLIDLLTPFGGAKELLEELRREVFPGQPVHQLAPAGITAQPARVMTWPA
ncbi:MAG: toxin-activating lysine-acyltransferase [Burkholderiaceae bacterium]|nr:toxin-activating lysine-acyltransferase [Burkholderiaceae bacterium]